MSCRLRSIFAVAYLKAILGAFSFALIASPPSIAQSIPPLKQGESYKSARMLLIKGGWQTNGQGGSCTGDNANRLCKLYPEYEARSASGHVRFLWRNAEGRALGVSTFSRTKDDSDPGTVTGWGWDD